MDKRGRFLLFASGMQEVGKSFLTIKQMLYQAYGSKNAQKGLILDINGEYESFEIDGVVHKIQEIDPKDIIRYSNHPTCEVRRIAPFYKNGQPMTDEDAERLVVKVMLEFRGGILLLEDFSVLWGDSLPNSVAKLLRNVRHRNCDVISHVQSVGSILPKVRQNAKIIRFHFQLDPVEDSRDKLTTEIEIFQIAEKIVNEQFLGGNKYFCVYIYRVDKKIKGQFSPKMFSLAVQEYISENPKVLRALLAKLDGSGKKVYTYEGALLQKTRELYMKYYGN